MNTKPAICKWRSSSTTSSSFEGARCGLLRSRLIQASWIGFFVSLIVVVAIDLFGLSIFSPTVETQTCTFLYGAHFLHILSFALALLYLYVVRSTPRTLRFIDNSLFGFNVILLITHAGYGAPGVVPIFGIALLLFVRAAFIPCLLRCQIGLAALAILSFPISRWTLYANVPEVFAFWEKVGGYLYFQTYVLSGTILITIMGVISVLITKTLYSMRKNLHEAQRLGNYTIEKELGEGGMGTVYIARHSMICRPTALKVLKTIGDDGAAISRFEREVQLSATLTHPNTIAIYDFGRSDENTFYYVMEYLDGMNLQQLIEKHGPIPAARTIHILQQAAGSLAEAHDRQIAHRDIKPANIFLTRRGGLFDFVKVLDFGLAKELKVEGAAAGLTKTGMLFGTPRYMAPETIYGTEKVDHRVDIYNLGAVGYWLLTGQHLFPSSSSVELLIDHAKTTPRKPSEVTEIEIPAPLEALIMKCLEKNPDDRFQDAAELLLSFEKLAEEHSWTQQDARQWWNLHVPSATPPPTGQGPQPDLQTAETMATA